ncbi:MAG: HEAT repeat domain-containing protein, partial [Spirochaetota bacterium]|nr:HEAT repeat domain-containing protein [Spirochaetota bacterium]
PITAFWACWVAGEMQYDAAIPYLVKIIRKKHKLTTGLDVRCAAIHALSKFESRKWNKLFLQLFRSRNPYVQEVSVTAIGTLRDYRLSSAFMELIQANTKTMSTSLRLGLIWAVGNMYIKSLRGTILEQGLDEKSEWIRVQQIWALYRLGTKKTPHLVVKSLYDKSDAVRNVALLVIQNVNDSSVAPDILKLLKDKSPDIRLIAAQLLGDWDIKKADTRIIPLLKDKDGRVQLAAVVALGKLRSKNAISPLIGLLQDRRNSERLKIIVVKTVLAIGHREAYSGMKDFYLEQVFNPSVNKDASSAKSSKSPSESSGPDSASPSNRGSDPDKSNTKKKKEILPPFRTVIEKLADKDQCVKLLSHKNDKVKLEALAAIPAFKEKITDFKFLMKMILGSSNEIKTEIIRVMGEVNYKDKEDIEILIALLPNEKVDRKIRIQVIYTLGRLQNPQGKAAILRQVNLLDEDFKIAALEALGYYGDDSSIETIEESLTYSKKESEQLVSIFSLAMLNKTEQKYQKIVLKLAKNPAKKLLHFLEEYFKRMPKATQTKLYKKIIRGLNSKEIKLIKDLFYPPKNDEENSPP